MDASLKGKYQLPRHPIILIFDDGYTDFYQYAYPLLKKYQMNAVVGIITHMIGGNYMTWEQIKEISRNGIEIAAHTQNHVLLSETSPVILEAEIEGSLNELNEKLGKSPRFMIYSRQNRK